MTITMFDSIDVSQLPSGAGYAYAGYVGGNWPTYAAIRAKFPHADVLSIAISANESANCLDVETGDATVGQVAGWVTNQLAIGAFKPCLYASVSRMSDIISQVQSVRPGDLALVRLWTAHYGLGEHICGPVTCNQLSVPADGTQWTDTALGRDLDQSVLLDTFFGAPAPIPAPIVPTWEVTMMNTLPTRKFGDKDGAQPGFVRRIQGLCLALLPTITLAIDGIYGAQTEAAVRQVQSGHGITVDGIVGPVTWAILVTGASDQSRS